MICIKLIQDIHVMIFSVFNGISIVSNFNYLSLLVETDYRVLISTIKESSGKK